ncbi:hypothetical protein CPB86DRAFT_708635 [Serendipita vermifera]|nr:hypothetical protein CPB86DRAFT_708635 [Serendipita vermifera]
MRRSDGIPKLAPEVEQGNVEYKLILMNPTAERLQRLVTQLNWRLMEGNGQAYYQLGVADSGELIGLTKEEMEATLETLENMAGELGASVVISREIEVRGRLSALVIESVNGMGGAKDSNGTPSSLNSLSSTSGISGEASCTDTEASETEATDDTDGNATDSPTTGEPNVDPDEIIVRSAPVPIAHSFLRRHKGKSTKSRQREDTLRPIDFVPSQGEADSSLALDDFKEEDDGDPQFGAFDMSSLGEELPTEKKPSLDPTRPPKSKPPKDSKPPKASKSKGSKAANAPFVPKTPEEIAQKIADKRNKRDRRREERKRALLDPVYDHSHLMTQDGLEGGIDYEKLIGDEAEDMYASLHSLNGPASPSGDSLMNSIATLKPPPGTSNLGAIVPSLSNANAFAQPRLIVEAIVVRKAGFGRGFVDLSQFDEELRHLPSFALA